MDEKVKARWVGSYSGVLRETGEALYPGKIAEVYAHEAYGQTLWQDPQNVNQIEQLPGISAKAEHAGIPRAALQEMGYQFMEKSANWEPVLPLEDWLKTRAGEAPEVQPAQVDLSAFYVSPAEAAAQQQASMEPPPDDPEAVEAGAVVEAHKDTSGTIIITTTPLESEASPAEPEAGASQA